MESGRRSDVEQSVLFIGLLCCAVTEVEYVHWTKAVDGTSGLSPSLPSSHWCPPLSAVDDCRSLLTNLLVRVYGARVGG